MSTPKDNPYSLAAVIIFACVMLFATLIGACDVPKSKAKRVLSGAGYTEIEIGGHAWFACGEGDTLASEFSATGPTGRQVEGAVCCGWAMKDCTIRSE